jgi:hypothetical protein
MKEVEIAPEREKNFKILPWIAGNLYKVGAIVIYNDELYKCTIENEQLFFNPEKSPVGKEWHLMDEQEVLALKDTTKEWDKDISYDVGELVYKDGKLWVSMKNFNASFNGEFEMVN